jgi:hypothetical protein
MPDRLRIDEVMGAAAEPLVRPASSRLKSRIYSSLVQKQAESGPLRSLSVTRADGRRLCVFEELVQIAPVPQPVKSMNPCRVCHARVLGENVESAPIYWPYCPYVLFQKHLKTTG